MNEGTGPESSTRETSSVDSLPIGNDTFITSDLNALPPEVAQLMDLAKPIPLGTAFFEKRWTPGDLVKAAAWAIALSVAGGVSLLIGVAMLLDFSDAGRGTNSAGWMPIFFGVTCAAGVWFLLATVRNGWTLMQRQTRGQPTRVGIFLTPDRLIEVTDGSWILVPRAQFLGLDRSAVRYLHKGKEHRFTLPRRLVAKEPAQLLHAIRHWAGVPRAT